MVERNMPRKVRHDSALILLLGRGVIDERDENGVGRAHCEGTWVLDELDGNGVGHEHCEGMRALDGTRVLDEHDDNGVGHAHCEVRPCRFHHPSSSYFLHYLLICPRHPPLHCPVCMTPTFFLRSCSI